MFPSKIHRGFPVSFASIDYPVQNLPCSLPVIPLFLDYNPETKLFYWAEPSLHKWFHIILLEYIHSYVLHLSTESEKKTIVRFIPFFGFLFFGKVTKNKKNSCPVCLFFVKKNAFYLKMTADFFVLWSLWPKTKNKLNKTLISDNLT